MSPRRAAFGSCQRLLRISLSQVGCDTRPRRHFSTDVTFVPLGDRHEWSVEGAAALGVSSLGRTTPDGIFTTCWFHSVVSVTAELLCMETVHPAAYVHRLACAHSHACSHAHSVTCTLSHTHPHIHPHTQSHMQPHTRTLTDSHAQSPMRSLARNLPLTAVSPLRKRRGIGMGARSHHHAWVVT